MRLVILKMLLVVGMISVGPFLFGQRAMQELVEIKSEYNQQQTAAQQRIEKYLKKVGAGREVIRRDGSIMLMVDISPSGVPIYIKSDNAEVATSLGVDELRDGGALGLNLEGAGIQIGIWDEGRVRNDHVEYVGRVTQVDNPSPSFVLHASHVLGTMIATGVNGNAKGMAPKATAKAFDFNGDVGEMSSLATPDQTSIILSNHSYGTLSGWDNDGGTWTWHGDASISNVRDWKFGFYNSTSSFYDNIAFNAPYYLIVKSAGNDNGDDGDGSRPPDCDPFDCIPTNGVAKNILTVGAVKKLTSPYTGPSDVVITSFSSFGPADDGRIKPDLVAPGQAVFSSAASSSSAYAILSGTSMSSPATTGTLALLQELHKNLNAGNLMKAATLKALAIHTTREAGPNPGPDFMFGWGLLDAEAAAKVLIDNDDQNVFIKELQLTNNEVFELPLTPKENTKITATLVWNDPAGPVLAPSLNPTTKMLVNDLDLSLVDDGGTSQFPWKLSSANPSAAATRGINSIDNVEKLEFDTPQPRNYNLRVSHKGTLVNGSQSFSLVVTYSSVIDPRITYYWIGDGGNWNDGTKWSLTSGGVPANTVPGPDDKIVFDENSFTVDNQTVNFAQDQQCYSLRWFANENIDLAVNTHTLSIASSLNLLSGNVSASTSGTLHFAGTSETDATVNLNDNNLDKLILQFSGLGAKWALMGDFTVNGIELISGDITMGDNTIVLESISSPGLDEKRLNFNATVITGAATLQADFSDITFGAEAFSIKIPTGLTVDLDFGINTDFTGTLDLAGGEITLVGSGSIQKVKGLGTMNINGNFVWNDFAVNAGSSIILQESSNQQFTDLFTLQSAASTRTSVTSSGALQATIDVSKHQKICLDNLDITNVSLTGEATIGVGQGSVVSGSPGWIQQKCDDILFADFDVEFACEKASVFFKDKSSGPIATRNWNFGETTSVANESTVQSPIHFYEQGGQYGVSLTVSDGQQIDAYLQTIQLSGNALDENTIELNNGKLISFLPASKYQWVLNGELLPNTNRRSIDFSNGYGEYAVLIFDDVCNRKSTSFLVTGIDAESNFDAIQVYPNPATEVLYVRSNEKMAGVALKTGIGQDMKIAAVPEEGGYHINVATLPKGFYILEIQYNRGLSFRRIVVR